MEDGGWRKALDIIHFSKTLYLYLALSSKSERVRKINDIYTLIYSVFLFCHRCVRLFAEHSLHRRTHHPFCHQIRVCLACGRLGKRSDLVNCVSHQQPASLPTRHELNISFGRVLARHGEDGKTICTLYLFE